MANEARDAQLRPHLPKDRSGGVGEGMSAAADSPLSTLLLFVNAHSKPADVEPSYQGPNEMPQSAMPHSTWASMGPGDRHCEALSRRVPFIQGLGWS
jgi:hypothetical protein